jgi:nitroimidazol reductase NimA-like FMN-containing flavoprotein (pyridoxamine 5'-phosphate oxidase superfamily)
VEIVRTVAPCDWTVRYYSVIGFGRAYIVTDYEEKVTGLNAIMEHYSGVFAFQFPETKVKRVAVIRVDIDSMTGKKAGY